MRLDKSIFIVLTLIAAICHGQSIDEILSNTRKWKYDQHVKAINYLDSIINKLDNNQITDKYDVLLLEKGHIFLVNNQYDSATHYYLQSHHWLDVHGEDSLAFEQLFQLGLDYRRIGQYDSAINSYMRASQYATSNNLDLLNGDAINAIGVAYFYQSNYIQALEYYLDAMKIYEKLGNQQKLAKSYNNIGIIYKNFNNYDLALSYFYKSIELLPENAPSSQYVNRYFNISSLYEFLGDYEKSKNADLKALKKAKRIKGGKSSLISVLYSHENLISAYGLINLLDSAKYHTEECMLVAIEVNEPYYTARANKAYGKYYLLSQNGDSAVFYLKLALNEIQKVDPDEEIILLIMLSEAYSIIGNKSNAVNHADIAYKLSVDQNYGAAIRLSLERLYQSYYDLGEYKKAYYYLSKYTDINDSTYNATKASIAGGMEANERLIIKKNENKLLQKDATIAAKTIQNQKIFFFGIIIVFILLVVIVVLWYLREKANQSLVKAELQMAEEQQQRLKSELQYKNQELTNFALQIVNRNEFIESIDHEVSKMAKNGLKGNESVLQLAKQIKSTLSLNKDRQEFEAHVDSIYQSFFDNLSYRFPQITESDKRLAALLRLNLSSKEISTILNISPKSVDMHRYRIRKKMNITNDQRLVDFFQNL